MPQSLPAPGHIARVRQRLYLVEGAVAAPSSTDASLVRLSCLDDDAQGQPLEVVWEKEIDAELLTGEAWEAIANGSGETEKKAKVDRGPDMFHCNLERIR
jgi:hypothetical protein